MNIILNIILNIIDTIVNVISTVVGWLRDASQKTKRILLGIVAGIVVAAAILAIGIQVGKSLPERSGPEFLGGLDLARYCGSYEYAINSGSSCSSEIDLSKACDWQYRRNDLKIVFESDSPYSGVCHTPKNVPVGGIRDMRGYCRDFFRTSVSVKAAPVDAKTWVCQMVIDMKVACTWQYPERGVEARREDGLWYCYS